VTLAWYLWNAVTVDIILACASLSGWAWLRVLRNACPLYYIMRLDRGGSAYALYIEKYLASHVSRPHATAVCIYVCIYMMDE